MRNVYRFKKIMTDVNSACKENPVFIMASSLIGGIGALIYGFYLISLWDKNRSPNYAERKELKYTALKNISETYNCNVTDIPFYRGRPIFSRVKLNCNDVFNKSYAYDYFHTELLKIESLEINEGLLVAGLILFMGLGAVSAFFLSVSMVNSKLAFKDSYLYQEREKQRKILHINKVMPELTLSETESLLQMGMRVWLLQGLQLVQAGKFPVETFLHISSFIAGNTDAEIESIRDAVSRRLYVQIKKENLNKYELMLFSKDRRQNDGIYKNEEGKAKLRLCQRLAWHR